MRPFIHIHEPLFEWAYSACPKGGFSLSVALFARQLSQRESQGRIRPYDAPLKGDVGTPLLRCPWTPGDGCPYERNEGAAFRTVGDAGPYSAPSKEYVIPREQSDRGNLPVRS